MSIITHPTINPQGTGNLQIALGTTLTSVGTICQYNGINKWSARKPVRYPSKSKISDMSITDISYGFQQGEVTSDSEGIYARLANGILTKSKNNNGDWVYLKPRGMTTYNEFCRLDDFTGYDTDAVTQFTVDDLPTSTRSGILLASMFVNNEASIKLQNMGLLQSTAVSSNPWRYGVVYRNVNYSTGAQLALSDYYVGGELTPINTVECSVTLPSEGTYDCVYIATQENSATSLQNLGYIYLPNGYWRTEYSSTAGGILLQPYQPSPTYKPVTAYINSQNNVTQIDFDWECINRDSTTYQNIRVYLHFYDQGARGSSSSTSLFSLGGGARTNSTLQYQLPIQVPLSSAGIVVYIVYPENSVTITRYFDFINDIMTITSPNPVTMQELIDQGDWIKVVQV